MANVAAEQVARVRRQSARSRQARADKAPRTIAREPSGAGAGKDESQRLRVLLAAANSRAQMLHDTITDYLLYGRRPLLRDALDAYREDLEAGR